MKHIVSFSGGKDSTATLLMLLERGMPVDEIIFCDTGVEFPEIYEHIQSVENYIGRQITVLHPRHSFEYFLTEIVKSRGKYKGNPGYGWPRTRIGRWCTGHLKQKVTKRYLRGKEDYTLYIGIAADETARHNRVTAANIRHPLYEWGVTESAALAYCQSKGFNFGGLYSKFQRLGCWCCPFQRKSSLRTLRKEYPQLWQELQRLDAKSPNKFTYRYSAADFERKFALEDAQCVLF